MCILPAGHKMQNILLVSPIGFSVHSFFAYDETIGLVCLQNGHVAEPSVNCEEAFGTRKAAADAISGKDLTVSFHIKDKVVIFSSAKNNVQVRGEVVEINTQLLFSRITCILNSSEEMEGSIS